ncbi:MAG TPA: undecaprenyldiphospho-muramoylpentapeptide beta-N-acetylglucosaminyltransferase [Candidatus Kryptonia bacterium]|nr:undecaprenyldiphospho-muramoylpentapeptide beta-N-acetylglucosaminyltransferase [Candidatus Kryptonia bacterium]
MIVAGGGTGGHLFPGLAVAQAAAATGSAVLFVGSRHGIEMRVIPQTSFPFRALPIRGLRGRSWRSIVGVLWQLPVSLIRAWRIVGQFRPDLVVGVGGYSSAPVVLAAWLRRVPRVLLEQNARPGMTNRWLARLSQRVCTTFEEAASFFPRGRVTLTGNPVRALSAHSAAHEGLTVLIFGGSQGAHRLNEAACAAAGALKQHVPNLRLIHQTGASDVDWVGRRYAEVGVSARVASFIDDMAGAYGDADLVVCRAGATTVAEITTLGKPAILVPYPYAADDHQRANAEVLVRHGAAEMILDRDLTGAVLAERVVMLATDPERMRAMATAARSLAVPDAAARVLAVCREVVQESVHA